MKVAKFGGSSLATPQQFDKVRHIIEADPARRLIVVSAPGKRDAADTKVTDRLIAAAEARLSGQTGEAEMQPVIDRFGCIAQSFGVPASVHEDITADLMARLHSDTGDPERYLDRMKAAGEDNNAKLMAAVLCAEGIAARYVDPREAGMWLSDEAGQARVLPRSYRALGELRHGEGVMIFPDSSDIRRQARS